MVYWLLETYRPFCNSSGLLSVSGGGADALSALTVLPPMKLHSLVSIKPGAISRGVAETLTSVLSSAARLVGSSFEIVAHHAAVGDPGVGHSHTG